MQMRNHASRVLNGPTIINYLTSTEFWLLCVTQRVCARKRINNNVSADVIRSKRRSFRQPPRGQSAIRSLTNNVSLLERRVPAFRRKSIYVRASGREKEIPHAHATGAAENGFCSNWKVPQYVRAAPTDFESEILLATVAYTKKCFYCFADWKKSTFALSD